MKRFKIGKSQSLPERLNQLDTASPADLRIFAAIKCNNYHAVENALHNKFSKYRIKKQNGNWKEWFAINKRQVERACEVCGGFFAADGEYATDTPILEKIIRWLDDHCPRTIEKLCHAALGILMLCYIASQAEPDIIPDVIVEVPAARGFVVNIGLIQDYHRGVLENAFKEKAIGSLGIKNKDCYEYWTLLWKDYTRKDSLYRDNDKYKYWKGIIAGWSLKDSAEYVLHNYVWENLFIDAYSDSLQASPSETAWLIHDENSNDCPMKGEKTFELDGKQEGGHNNCVGELTIRKTNAEKTKELLEKIRKIYSDMIP